jgi:hypothetical protein
VGSRFAHAQRARSLAALLLFAVAASCTRCAVETSAGAAEELLGAGAPASAVVTAPLSRLANNLAQLTDRAASLPGGEQLGEARKQLASQLGFDPLTREGLLSAGLDPNRGAAFAVSSPRWIAALPLAKPELFLQTVDRLVRERGGYTQRTDEPRENLRVAVYTRDPQARAKLGAAVVRGYGLVALSDDPASDIEAALQRPPEHSLAQDPRLKNARERLGAQDLIVLAPAGSPLAARFVARPLPVDAYLGLVAGEGGLAVRFFAQLPEAQAGQAAAMLPGGGKELIALVPGDAPLRLRLGLSPAELLKHLDLVPGIGGLRAALHGADAELVEALAPGVAVSLGTAKHLNVAEAIDYGFDFRRKSPFDTVELVALAQVADRPRAVKALEEIAKALPQLGASARRLSPAATDWQVTYLGKQGARFGLRELAGKPTAYLLGGGIAPEDLKPSPSNGGILFEDAGAALQLDFGRLSDKLRALPESSYGSGPQAYVARSLVSQIAEPLRPLRLTGSMQAGKDGLSAGLVVQIVAQ